MKRRNLLQAIGTAGLLGLANPREQKAQEQVARATRGMPIPKIKDISVIECQPAGVRLTVVKITTDQDGLLRLRLRHLHAARRPGEAGGGEISQAVPDGQDHGPDRRHLAILLRQLLLEERPGAEQRHQRSRPGVVGHQGPAGGDAGVSACGRQVPRGGGLLRACRRRRISEHGGQRRSASWRRDSATCACRWACREWRATAARAARPADQGAARQAGLRAGLLCPPRAEAVRSLPQGTGRRGRAAARHARARVAEPGGAVLQGRREVQAVLHGRSALAGGHRLLPPDPAAVRHADRHGRAVQQPARMAAADRASG